MITDWPIDLVSGNRSPLLELEEKRHRQKRRRTQTPPHPHRGVFASKHIETHRRCSPQRIRSPPATVRVRLRLAISEGM